jgi:murein DD-endopeptidase MepM/ murein hydrolase activator NlpD
MVAGLAAVIASLAAAQDAGVPSDDAGPVAPVAPCTEPGCGGTELDGIAIPAGVVGRIAWADSEGDECHRYHGRRMCEGPRRVPLLEGELRTRAVELDLLRTTRVARVAITRRPDDTWIAAAGAAPPAGELLWPVAGGRIWRHHGRVPDIIRSKRGGIRRSRRTHRHEGVDIGAPAGTPILAANAGIVVYSDNGMAGYGNVVVIVHGDGSLTLYAHCTATFVVAGQVVARGQVIAIVGDTGLAHGAHLHFEYRIDGTSEDPEPLFVGRPAPAAAPEEPVPPEAGSP